MVSFYHRANLTEHRGGFVPELSWESLHGRDRDVYFNTVVLTQELESHGHAFLELAYIRRGRVEHICNGHVCRAGEGSYFIVDDGVAHAYRCLGAPVEIWNCIFRPAFLDAGLAHCRNLDSVLQGYPLQFSRRFHFRPHSGAPFTDEEGRVLRALMGIQEEYEADRPGREPLIRAYLIEILIETMRQLYEELQATPLEELDDDVRALRVLADTAFARDLSLSRLAEKRYCSLSHLSRRFEEACGCGFKEYLQNRRVEEACRLLANTSRKVSDIAKAVGYHDLKFFNRLFLRIMGMPPSEYRRQHRQSDV